MGVTLKWDEGEGLFATRKLEVRERKKGSHLPLIHWMMGTSSFLNSDFFIAE